MSPSITPILAWRAARARAKDETGAVLMIVAMLVLILMLCAAFAVDFGSWYARAERLQNAADTAALAGANEFDLTSDRGLAEARVLDVLAQNGIFNSDTINIQLTYPGELDLDQGEVRVSITDNDVDLFFASLVIDNMQLRRDATALVDNCGSVCTSTLQIPPPFNEISLIGSGDGTLPIVVGDRIYGINHHVYGGNIVCISIPDEAHCPTSEGWSGGAKAVSPGFELLTENMTTTEVWDDKIFWLGQRSNGMYLACFDTDTNNACTYGPQLVDSLGWNTSLSFTNRARASALTKIDNRLYVFTDEHNVHCRMVSDFSLCPTFTTNGKPAGLNDLPDMPSGSNAAMSDRIIDEDNNHIYVSTHFRAGTSVANYGIRVHCWDADIDLKCGHWPNSVKILPSSSAGSPWLEGRLYFNRDSSGNRTGVCATGEGDRQCLSMTGSYVSESADGFGNLDTLLGPLPGGNFLGKHMYIPPPVNRLIINVGFTNNVPTRCWDFNTSSYCGGIDGGGTKDYGYAMVGGCIISLGDTSSFWMFSTDMTQDCDEGVAETMIFPCVCYNGDTHWGSVLVDGNLDAVNGPYLAFTVDAVAPDGTNVRTADLLQTGGVVDLDGISADYAFLRLKVTVKTKPGENPWATGDVPTVIVGWSDKPHLVD